MSPCPMNCSCRFEASFVFLSVRDPSKQSSGLFKLALQARMVVNMSVNPKESVPYTYEVRTGLRVWGLG